MDATKPTAKHTPGQWTVGYCDQGSRPYYTIIAPWHDGAPYWATGRPAVLVTPDKATAERSARALNAHADLLAACEKVRAALNCNYDRAIIESEYGALLDAAIAAARGE